MTHYNFIPTLFDGCRNGAFTYQSVLAYHKSIEKNMPADGLVWLCEHPKMETLQKRRAELTVQIKTITDGMKGQHYVVWKVLDSEAHLLRTRLQLVCLCIENQFKSMAQAA